jgi:predicted MFS family arabinose efflux permease
MRSDFIILAIVIVGLGMCVCDPYLGEKPRLKVETRILFTVFLLCAALLMLLTILWELKPLQ